MGSEKLNCTSSADTELDSDGTSGGTKESGVVSLFVLIVIMKELADRGPSVLISEAIEYTIYINGATTLFVTCKINLYETSIY